MRLVGPCLRGPARRRARSLATLLVAAVAVVAGCGVAGEPRSPGPRVAQSDRAPLRLMLSSDRPAYAVGQPVTLTLVVENIGPAPAVITAPSAQLYDFAVFRGDREIWRWSADRAFPAQITEWTLAPGQRREFSEPWRPAPGTAVPGDVHCRGGADGWAPAGRPAAPSRHCRPLTARGAAAGKPAVRQIRLAAVPCEAIEPQTGFCAPVGYAEAARVVAVKRP